MSRKLTFDEFYHKFVEKYPDKHYRFQQNEYIDTKTRITVTCPKHGDFKMRPNDLLNGTGCPYCGGTKKGTTETFIKKARQVHGNYFDYSKTVYIDSKTKIIVTCPIHGDYTVKPSNHLSGQNCPKCRKDKIKHPISKLKAVNKSTKKLTQDEFAQRVQEKWKGQYIVDDQTIYKSNKDKLKIKCKVHDSYFEITPNHLLNGRGCPLCAKNKQLTTQHFIEKINEKFPNHHWTFEKTVYKSTHIPVCITCHNKEKPHDFWAMPSNLLRGQDCPLCQQSRLETFIRNELDKRCIRYETQKRFEWLGRQSLDFYLGDYNAAIECQGAQHFYAVNFGGWDNETLEIKFRELKERDELKLLLCKEHGINLFYYSKLNLDYPYLVYENAEDMFNEITNINNINLDKQ